MLSSARLALTLLLGSALATLTGCTQCCNSTAQPKNNGSTATETKSSESTDGDCCDECCKVPSKDELLTLLKQKNDAVAAIQLKSVKLDQLLKDIGSHKGKVVVVDLWGDFCLPCKKEFPNLVKMHKEHAKDGLVCVSVSVDEPERREAALKFLKKQDATFANYFLDEDAQVWQDRWVLKAVPAVFVFGRDGKQAARFDCDDPDRQFTYQEVEKKVVELLQTK